MHEPLTRSNSPLPFAGIRVILSLYAAKHAGNGIPACAEPYIFAQQPLRNAGQLVRIGPSLGMAELLTKSAIVTLRAAGSKQCRSPGRAIGTEDDLDMTHDLNYASNSPICFDPLCNSKRTAHL